MSLQNLGLLNGIHSKMGFLNVRQEIYSQNVANADTPGFRPKDIELPDFSKIMGNIGEKRTASVSMTATDSGHLSLNEGDAKSARHVKSKEVYEASLDDNAVVLEEQIFKASKNSMDYQAMTNLYRRNIGMVKVAVLGNK